MSNQNTQSVATTEQVAPPNTEARPQQPGRLSRMWRSIKMPSSILFGYAVTFVTALIVHIMIHNAIFTGTIIILNIVIWGIRIVPTVHNGLLLLFGSYRTKIGFCEGIVWIPWFLGGRLQLVDIHRTKLDIPEEDTYSKGDWHIIYDIVLTLGVATVTADTIWKNLFRAFICFFTGRSNAVGLYNFISMNSKDESVGILESHASELTREAINNREFKDIFHPERMSQDMALLPENAKASIQLEVLPKLQQRALESGLAVYEFTLRDTDLHTASAHVMEQRRIAEIQAEAVRIMYSTIKTVSEELDASGVSKQAIMLRLAEAIHSASEKKGILGGLSQMLSAKVAGELSETVPQKESGLVLL